MQKEEELSEEDQQLKENLELMVERVKDVEPGVQKMAIAAVAAEIKCVRPGARAAPRAAAPAHPRAHLTQSLPHPPRAGPPPAA